MGTVDMVAGVILATMAWRLYDHEVGPDAEPHHFLPSYKEAACQVDDQNAQARAGSLLAMSDEEFAEHVQYEGSTIGGVVMVLICVGFCAMVGLTFAALLEP